MSMMSNKLSSSVHHRNLLFVDIIINVLVLGRIEEKNHSSKKYTPSLFACFFWTDERTTRTDTATITSQSAPPTEVVLLYRHFQCLDDMMMCAMNNMKMLSK